MDSGWKNTIYGFYIGSSTLLCHRYKIVPLSMDIGEIRKKTKQIWAGVNPTYWMADDYEQVQSLRMKGEALMKLELSA